MLMNTKTIEKLKDIGSIAFIVVLLGAFGYIIYGSVNLKNNHKFTIGITEDTHYDGRGIKRVDYLYIVKGDTISGESAYRNEDVPRGRYIVKYAVKMPSSNYMSGKYEIPPSIKSAPPEGWKEIPKEIIEWNKTHNVGYKDYLNKPGH